eukprot:TRINITY_DN63182_c1_g1_i1.p1 TRINITY_DN63182_c1_g1~~TRINITY_DN63182_c1_g1_i1.p1  ORF type:complete len:472 (-),score=208.70 TRINITY_DN63182_c1_g1_i1:153-1568(-)
MNGFGHEEKQSERSRESEDAELRSSDSDASSADIEMTAVDNERTPFSIAGGDIAKTYNGGKKFVIRFFIVLGVLAAIIVAVVVGLIASGRTDPSGQALQIPPEHRGDRWHVWRIRHGDTRVDIVYDAVAQHVRTDGYDEKRKKSFSVVRDGTVSVGVHVLGETCASAVALGGDAFARGRVPRVNINNWWRFVEYHSHKDGFHYPGSYTESLGRQCHPQAVQDVLVSGDSGGAPRFTIQPADRAELETLLDGAYSAGTPDPAILDDLMVTTKVHVSDARVVVVGDDSASPDSFVLPAANDSQPLGEFLESSWACSGTNSAVQRQCERLRDTIWEPTGAGGPLQVPMCSALDDLALALVLQGENGCGECSAAITSGCRCWVGAYWLRRFALAHSCRQIAACGEDSFVYPCSLVDVGKTQRVYALTSCTLTVKRSCPVVHDRLMPKSERTFKIDDLTMATTTNIAEAPYLSSES